ncbi:hypothetical protein B0J12DRAFT_704891 [Macrophomina phaseolina]|uniref:Short-chain dehydrogenase/reductase SDR n=1 Tax=Macrophomina phaseolina TaxID=35725 RepID=A0ABQ8FUV8_9PEZI|nr:hypothetical protein B0J12DRAFT_704891 [Macrophomina phaseolina]
MQLTRLPVAITGVARGGIGGVTAVALAKGDPELLILVSRTQAKLDEIISDIKAIKANANVKSVLVDLTSQASVRKAAEEIKAIATRLDLLINNAGFAVYKRQYSPEGIESQLAGNHIGPFLLTNLLRDRLVAAAQASSTLGATRVVSVASEVHRASPFRFHDYNNEGWPIPAEEAGTLYAWPPFYIKPGPDGYSGAQAYGHSKTANILFTVGLNKRLAGTGVVAYSVHPGTIVTNLTRDVSESEKEQVAALFKASNPKTVEQGGSTTLVAALDPLLNEIKGAYLSDCQIEEAEPYAVDPEKAEKLWKLSEELVKQTF